MRVVIGYGNPLRRDDALGPHVAALVAEREPQVEACLVHELTPDLAELLAKAELGVFVDARQDRLEQGVFCEALDPTTACTARMGHHSDPRLVLALSLALYGRTPPAWLVTLPAHDLGFGEGLSRRSARWVAPAVARICRLLAEPSR